VDLGVDRSPLAAGSIYLFFFWFAGLPERQIWPMRVAGSLPLAIGVDRGQPKWPDLSFFFFFFVGLPEMSPEVGGVWRWVAALFAGGGRWVIYLIT
jgi:hypothetical protein